MSRIALITVLLLSFNRTAYASENEFAAPDDVTQPTADYSHLVSLQPLPKTSKCGRKSPSPYKSGDAIKFMRQCVSSGVKPQYCADMTHPNSDEESKQVFRCTYPGAPHVLIPEDEETWKHAFVAAKTLQEVEEGVCTKRIYNWFRPEPYNKRVDGSTTRHPNATAIDIEFCDKKDAKIAHAKFCTLLNKCSIFDLGSYSQGNKIHIGVCPEKNSTWGPLPCPIKQKCVIPKKILDACPAI